MKMVLKKLKALVFLLLINSIRFNSHELEMHFLSFWLRYEHFIHKGNIN